MSTSDSRLVPHAQFYWNEQLPRLEDCLKRAILRYGCPLAIYADQGQVYRANQLDTACASLGIQRILARPYSPQAKGKACPERSEGSNASSASSSPPSSLKWRSLLPSTPSTTRMGTSVNQSLLAWIEVVYTVPAFLVGQAVELRYDPFDLTTLEVWLNGQYLAQAEPAHVLTTVQPGLTPDPTPPPPQPTTGVDYLALLRQERERLLQQQLPPIPFQHHFPALITGDGLP